MGPSGAAGGRGALLLLALTALCGVGEVRVAYGAAGLGAEAVCARVPGLTARQRAACRAQPDAVAALGDGVRLATAECRRQFRHHRWNCTGIDSPAAFGHVVVVGSREAAFTYAITSAGATFAVAAACARGNISACGCEPAPAGGADAAAAASAAGFKWGGCGVDATFGARFARRFLDARELEGDERSLMNLHNNRAGRKAVKMSLQKECKCHGVSGSCTMKTCWKTLPSFQQIGDMLMKKYYRARPVTATREGGSLAGPPAPAARGAEARRARRLHLVLSKGRSAAPRRPPKKSDLVFLQMSPNYCERDLAAGSLGTAGRACNRTSRGIDGCDLMCCGRGYNTHQYTKTVQCKCVFHWCCKVECQNCTERKEEYTCK